MPTASSTRRIDVDQNNFHVSDMVSQTSPHILCFFHFPRLNRIALTAAMELSAIAMAAKAPLECIFSGIASQ
jgi:hypothetical protein